MAKKNVTAEQVRECVDKASQAAGIGQVVKEAIGNMRIDDIPDAYDLGRSLVVAARDLNDAALALFSRDGLQKQRAELDQLRRQKKELGGE